MQDINKNRKVCVPSYNVKDFNEIKEQAKDILDAYKELEDQIPDMLMIIYSRKNEDGTYDTYMCATPESNLEQIKLFDANISLKVNRND